MRVHDERKEDHWPLGAQKEVGNSADQQTELRKKAVFSRPRYCPKTIWKLSKKHEHLCYHPFMDTTPEHISYTFCQPVANWFSSTFEKPTPVQEQAWSAIQQGMNTLVIAPTGSGKTLAAFLSAIDRLTAEKAHPRNAATKKEQKDAKGVRILYVSPLKALGADVERNLQVPLSAIVQHQHALQASGAAPEATAVSQITVGLRTGDTPSAERARLMRNPPDILITTPESLYLMLTSKARNTLATVETLIIDEVHSIAGTKRGTHFSLSMERLDALVQTPVQRIGLSATIKPIDVAAQFLGGTHPVHVVQDDSPPSFSLKVTVPVSDMTNIAPYATPARHDPATTGPNTNPDSSPETRMGSSSIWPYIEASILDLVLAHTSTIVFVNSRGICERLTAHLNTAYDRRMGRSSALDAFTNAGGAFRSEMGSTTQLVAESADPIAKAHHGSVSKDRRAEIEQELKDGQLRCVVATSSLELGIDMGQVDLVIQVAAPLSVSSGLQRIGRANHQVNGKSVGYLYPRTRPELLDTAFITRGMLEGDIEKTALITNALDVLAQQTAAEVAMHPDGIQPDDWLSIVRKSACYQDLPERAFQSVIDMLAGAYSGPEDLDLAPRLLFDREQHLLKPLPRTQKLAISSAGTIPDRGLYPVMLKGAPTQKSRKRVGELDEEMVHESRVGDVIILGTSTWRIAQITNDRVLVTPAPGRSARLPFWHGEGPGRSLEAGRARGQMQRALDAQTSQKGTLTSSAKEQLATFGFNENGIDNLGAFIALQRAYTQAIPSDRLILLELCPDEAGAWYAIIHSPFGKRVHEPWALALSCRIQELWGFNAQCAASDDGIVMRIFAENPDDVAEHIIAFQPDEIADLVTKNIANTSLFASRFRECAARSLLMRTSSPGKRTPLWQQRLRGGQMLEAVRKQPDFPVYVEAMRECLTDVYDLNGLRWLMEQVESGVVRIKRMQTDRPSPFASPLLFGYLAEHLYDTDMPHAEHAQALLSVDPDLLGELLGMPDPIALLEPSAIAETTLDVQHLSEERRFSGMEGVAELLRILGPLSQEQLGQRTQDIDDLPACLEELEHAHRICPVCMQEEQAWATPEDALRLHNLIGTAIPEWVHSWKPTLDEGAASPVANVLAIKFARSHSFFTTEMLAHWLHTGTAPAENALRQLEQTGIVRRLTISAQTESVLLAARKLLQRSLATMSIPPSRATSLLIPVSGCIWVHEGVMKRMRLRSRDIVEDSVQPVADSVYAQFVSVLQMVGGSPENSEEENLAQCISLFEGSSYSLSWWENTIFPLRVPGYKPALLDSFLETQEVIWSASNVSGKQEHVQLFPSDSPFAPQLFDQTDLYEEPSQAEPGARASEVHDALEQEVMTVLFTEGSASFATVAQRLQELSGDEPVSIPLLVRAFEQLLTHEHITSTSIDPIRNGSSSVKSDNSATPRTKRISSRRGMRGLGFSRLSKGNQGLRGALAQEKRSFEALSGTFTPLLPPEVSSTERAVAQVESILDLYGIVCPKTIEAAGCKGGMQALYAVLRGMEDAGEVIRGTFVNSLGSSQFARRSLIERLRSEETEPPSFVVMDARDPAQLYGTVLPWPESNDAMKLPTQKDGCLVVLFQGAPVLFATKHIKELFLFTEETAPITEAASALIQYLAHSSRRAASGKDRLILEKVNGTDIFSSPYAIIFKELGFIQDTHGLRLLVQPC